MRIAVAPQGFDEITQEELAGRTVEKRGRLFFYEGPDPVWAQNLWLDVHETSYRSVSDAVRQLRAIQRNWWLHPVGLHRRAALIRDQLAPFKPKPVTFPTSLPKSPLGSFTILDEGKLVYSARCSNPYPDGEITFVENKTDPPSRAYLKLWEFFTLAEKYPGPGERVVDLGSSPGGWTWVLDQLGCEVTSVDRAPLASNLQLSPRVRMLERNAFTLEPSELGNRTWLFSDIICYPEKLYELVQKWLESGRITNFVCTIKFQAATNFEIIEKFRAIPGSTLRHLHANKHELTWSLLR